ncbi:MAG: transcriptional regulator [Puniceicoccaceae bacterium]
MSQDLDIELPFDQLERSMHEPARLAVLSLLMNADKGLSYRELQDQLGLTYGNLERHMKVLLKAGVVEIEKVRSSRRAQSFARFSESGREAFLRYLDNLEQILQAAQGRKKAEQESGTSSLNDLSSDEFLNLI